MNKKDIAKKLDKWLDTLNYWFEHIEEFGERYPDMEPEVRAFDKIIDEMYILMKELENENTIKN